MWNKEIFVMHVFGRRCFPASGRPGASGSSRLWSYPCSLPTCAALFPSLFTPTAPSSTLWEKMDGANYSAKPFYFIRRFIHVFLSFHVRLNDPEICLFLFKMVRKKTLFSCYSASSELGDDFNTTTNKGRRRIFSYYVISVVHMCYDYCAHKNHVYGYVLEDNAGS